jgi:hypothetical protein
VFFAPGSIDGRHPASAEGALWPLFLQRYEPFGRSNDLLLLRKRAQPLSDLLGAPIGRHAGLGERIDVPASTAPLFVKIDVQFNLLGRLAEQLLKPPSIMLRAFYAEGSEGLFAHAPSELTLAVGSSASVEIGFGLRNSAWQGDHNSRDVCFLVVGDTAELLFSRCLNPKVVASDRGPQSTNVKIPAGTREVKFRTFCIENCNWAWSYWSKADLAAAAP